MDSKKYNVAKLSNSFSTGSGGANFERHIQAIFVLALLVDGFSPIIDAPIERLEFQAKHLGYDVDDLVVASSNGAHLLCQIKHSLSVSENNSTFQEVITSAWSDFKKSSFNPDTDKIALITGVIAKDSMDALRDIHEQASAALSAELFNQRIEQSNFTAPKTTEKLNAIKKCIQNANSNVAASDEEVWKFCQCFILSIFDLDYEESINRTLAQALIRCKTKTDAKLVWSRLADLCGTYNQKAATITRDKLPEDILILFGCADNTAVFVPVNFIPNSLWADISLIGSWDENNPHDIQAIEQILGQKYDTVQRDCQMLLIDHAENLDLQDGKWKIKNRQAIMAAAEHFYFDNTIKEAFQIVNGYVKEISKQFSENGEFGSVIPASGRFNHSDTFRKSLLEGLCILCNGKPLSNCTENLLAIESRKLVHNALSDQNWIGLVSMSDLLSDLGELNPSAYLNVLEELIRHKPQEIEKLFPRKRNRGLIDQNFISDVLFTFECLAWDERYIVQSIRCLGALECLSYEQTNWSNTPINTIVNILSPLRPQTCASVEKQKNAIQVLKVEKEELCWAVLTHLLPTGRHSILHSTARPKFLIMGIPEEVRITEEDRNNLFQKYMQQAVSIAGNDPVRLVKLVEHASFMSPDDLLPLFETIRNTSQTWTDNEKGNAWIKLCDLKYRVILEYENTPPDSDAFKELCNTVDVICPESIMQRHKRLFLSHFNEFPFDENGWKVHDQKKQDAVREIYQTLGLCSVVEFGISINALHDVGRYLGKIIDANEFSKIIPEYRVDNHVIFYSSLVRAFWNENRIDSIRKINLEGEEPAFIAKLLIEAPFTQELIDIVPEFLPGNEDLFWEAVVIPPFHPLYSQYDVTNVVDTLLSYHRAATAINAVGPYVDKLDMEDSLLCKILTQAPTDDDAKYIEQYSVQKMIQHLQNSGKTDMHMLSDIEYIYLPFLGESSPTQPRAIHYRLANEPEYFCEIMKLMYKKRHETNHSGEALPPAVGDRLFQLTFHYQVIPGTDWDGVFYSDIFTSWMDTVKTWAKENDRFEVSMLTIGNGLSYAAFSESGVIDNAIMAELNAPENNDLRRGYRIGKISQRGFHPIDPEGKAEKELAAKYNRRAEAVEALGYSRFSELLKEIAEWYLYEARDNAKLCAMDEN